MRFKIHELLGARFRSDLLYGVVNSTLKLNRARVISAISRGGYKDAFRPITLEVMVFRPEGAVFDYWVYVDFFDGKL